jgi:hypothetical protein
MQGAEGQPNSFLTSVLDEGGHPHTPAVLPAGKMSTAHDAHSKRVSRTEFVSVHSKKFWFKVLVIRRRGCSALFTITDESFQLL